MSQTPPTQPPKGFAIKLLLLILSIIVIAIAAILLFVEPVTLKHFAQDVGIGLVGIALFAASFLPIP